MPFDDDQFDLVLCSHFLFLYSDNLSLEFHLDAIREMCRVASDVRVFPILDYNAKRSLYIESVIDTFSKQFKVVLEKVAYEFQKGGHEMLRIFK